MCVEAPESMLVYDTGVVDNTADVDGGGVLMVSLLNGTADFVRSPITNNTVCACWAPQATSDGQAAYMHAGG